MAEMKRTAFERERDLRRITAWYLEGETQSKIGERLGLSQKQISYDLQEVRRRWRESTTLNIDKLKLDQLSTIDELERVYWTQFEKSKNDDDVGDPRFLDGVRKCVEDRRKLFGLDAPDKQEHSGGVTVRIVYDDTDIDTSFAETA